MNISGNDFRKIFKKNANFTSLQSVKPALASFSKPLQLFHRILQFPANGNVRFTVPGRANAF